LLSGTWPLLSKKSQVETLYFCPPQLFRLVLYPFSELMYVPSFELRIIYALSLAFDLPPKDFRQYPAPSGVFLE